MRRRRNSAIRYGSMIVVLAGTKRRKGMFFDRAVRQLGDMNSYLYARSSRNMRHCRTLPRGALGDCALARASRKKHAALSLH
jgi:hypothetical protein